MKKLFTILASVIFVANVFAQSPQSMSYQAVVRNTSNNLVANTQVGMRISILQGSSTGTATYVETQKPNTNTNGLASIAIGGGTVVSGTFASINWPNGPYFIKTETDPTGGTNYSITGTSQLLSVPYALHAKTAENIIGNTSGGFLHYIGEVFGGGVIFHLWKDASSVEHGLIVSLTDTSTSQVWSNVTSTLIGTSPSAGSFWDGITNSNAIVNQAGHTTSAAKLCLDKVSGGQSDWYLPAIDELSLLYNNRFIINKSLSIINGASQIGINYYWSSTEQVWAGTSNSGLPLYVYFFSGNSNGSYGKSSTYYVRAIRAF